MEQQDHQKAPSSLLPGVLDHLGLRNTPSSPGASLELLMAMLQDADWRVRAAAVGALGEHPTSISLEPLLRALRDEDTSVRAAAVYALGNRNGLAATKHLTKALRDSEWLVREAAALTLGNLGEQAPTEKLIASLDDENEFVREAARMSLEQNEALRFDDADDNVIITNLDTFAYAGHSEQHSIFTKPRRLAAALLTAIVVISLVAAWLLLLPRLQSSRLEHQNPSPHPGAILFRAHYQGGAFLPQWTPDGKRMAFVDDYGGMYVWDASAKKLNKTFILPFHADPDPFGTWAWTSDGRHIVSFDYTGEKLQLWDAITGQNVFSSNTHSNTWADDGKFIAVIDQSNTMHIRNMDTGQELSTISSEHFKKICTISWSPDGRLIATASLDGVVEIWDATTGNRLQSFSDLGKAPQGVQTITSLFTAWSPDSTRLLTQRAETNSAYKSLQIWDVTTGRKLRTFSGHSNLPFMAQWFSDGSHIMSTSPNEILIWEAATGHVTMRISNNRSQNTDLPVLSPNERLLAITNGGSTIQIWDTTTGQKIFTYRGHTANVISATTSLAWSPDGAYISSADTDGNIMVWEVGTGKLIFKYKLNFFLPSQFIPTNLAALVWSPDGTMLAIASDEGTVAVLQAT